MFHATNSVPGVSQFDQSETLAWRKPVTLNMYVSGTERTDAEVPNSIVTSVHAVPHESVSVPKNMKGTPNFRQCLMHGHPIHKPGWITVGWLIPGSADKIVMPNRNEYISLVGNDPQSVENCAQLVHTHIRVSSS